LAAESANEVEIAGKIPNVSRVSFLGLVQYLQRLPRKPRAILFTCVYGLVAGAAAVAFQFCLSLVYYNTLVRLSHLTSVLFLIGSFAVVISSSLVVGFLLTHFCQEARGSGIPQLKLAFWKEFGVVSWRVVWVKFLAGVLSVGGGSSLGREGPSVHLAGGLASNLAGLMGEAKQNRRMAAAAGAAAGLAAAFNTPLAAMTFVLEEIVADLNSRFLGSVLLASVVGAFVVHGLIGPQPAFTLGQVKAIGWRVYLLIPFVSAAASLAGIFFQRATMSLRIQRKAFARIPTWIRPAIGGMITWLLGSVIFLRAGHLGVFSLGYDDLSLGLNNALEWKIAGVLLVAKITATCACYGFGSCGGIFSPTLFFGGATGVFLGGLLAAAGVDLAPGDRILLAVIGMSSCLGSVVRAPITGILIVFEMTHEFALVPGLMLGALVSQAISVRLNKHSFYEEILIQDGHNLEHVIPPRDLQQWQQWPISSITNFKPVVLEALDSDALRKLLLAHPYQNFPVLLNGKVEGILSRKEAEAALLQNRAPKLDPLVVGFPDQTVRRLQFLLLDSPSGFVVILDKPGGRLLGIVTLHDLLRAEVSFTRETS